MDCLGILIYNIQRPFFQKKNSTRQTYQLFVLKIYKSIYVYILQWLTWIKPKVNCWRFWIAMICLGLITWRKLQVQVKILLIDLQFNWDFPDVEEFVFSSWYFLIFYILSPSPLESSPSVRTYRTVNRSSLSSQILACLSNKLSVPASTFIVNDIHKVILSTFKFCIILNFSIYHNICELMMCLISPLKQYSDVYLH